MSNRRGGMRDRDNERGGFKNGRGAGPRDGEDLKDVIRRREFEERGGGSRRFDEERGGGGNSRRGFDEDSHRNRESRGFKRQFDEPGVGMPARSKSGQVGVPSMGMETAFGGPNRKYESKVTDIVGPSTELPPMDTSDKKFGSGNKVYVGNLPSNFTEADLKSLCKPYGEIDDVFLNKEKKFALGKFDYRVNAEKFKHGEDGKQMSEGRSLKIKLTTAINAVKVKNLNAYVTNELLHKAFSIFGPVESVKIIPNARNQKLTEGIVEFVQEKFAKEAVNVTREFPYVLTHSLIPVVVEQIEEEQKFVEDDKSEKFLRRDEVYYRERNIGPRFIKPDTFDFQFCNKYTQLAELRKQKEEALEREMQLEEEKLVAQTEIARYDFETEIYKKMFQRREEERLYKLEMLNQQTLDVDRRLEMELENRQLRESMFDFNIGGRGDMMNNMNMPMDVQQQQDMRSLMSMNTINPLMSDNDDRKMNPMMGGMSGPPREQPNNLDPEVWQQFENNTGKRPRFPNEVFKSSEFGRGGGKSGGGGGKSSFGRGGHR